MSKLESIQARDALKSEEKMSIWADPVVEREENEKANQEKNEVVIQLLMTYYTLMKHQDTNNIINSDVSNTDETNTDEADTYEAAKEAINAKAEGEEITLKFS